MALFKYTKRNANTQGFSLPELMVSIGIITIVTGILLFRFDVFNSTTLLSSQAYETALDIRQAQVAGVSVRSDGTDQFREEFGIYFSRAYPRQYIYYRDSGDATPAAFNSGEEVERMLLDSRFQITNICANDISLDCAGGTELDDLSIYFARPNFDARFHGSNSGGVVSGIQSVSIAIQPVSGGAANRLVFVNASGQISVK